MEVNKETEDSKNYFKNLTWLVHQQIGRMSIVEFYDNLYNYREHYEDLLLDVPDVCRILNLSRSGVYSLLKKKHINGKKINRKWKIKISAVDLYIGRFLRW
jgi:excisionase family DNA binding protein